MSVIWVLERPRPAAESSPALLQGDFAVRAFASLKNFLRLAPLKGRFPDLVLVRSCDFLDDLGNLENLLSLRYETVPRVYLGLAEGFQPAASDVTVLAESEHAQLPFLLQQILRDGAEYETKASLCSGGLELDFDGLRLRLLPAGDWLRMAPKEAQILRYLLRNPERCLSHEDLVQAIWKDVRVSPRSMASHISRLRRYLQGSQVEIRNVYGGGYLLRGPASESTAD